MTSRRDFVAGLSGWSALAPGGFGPRQQCSCAGRCEIAARISEVADGQSNAQPVLQQLFQDANPRGATICMPPGDYRLDSPLVIPRHITVAFERGARLLGEQVAVHGSIEAGFYQVFDGVRVSFGTGGRCWAVPQWWGAQGDGEHDDTAALQAALDTHNVFLPAGKYRTTARLVVRNRSTIIGVGNAWSPQAETDSWIVYDGPADPAAAVLQVATAGVGRQPTAALTNVHLEKVVLDGGNRAGYGLYSVYCSDDSSFTDVTARRCTQHGVYVANQWYASYRNIVARDNPGCGITIGRVFDGWEDHGVNGVYFSNLRAARNGADESFDESTNLRWGYGILFRPGGGTVLRNVVAERNFGAGLIYDLGPRSSNRIDGTYLEGNGLGGLAAGATRAWGLVVVGHRNARANEICSAYLHGAVGDSRAQSIWLTGNEPRGDLVLRDVSFGQFLHADWLRVRMEGHVYSGLRDYVMVRDSSGRIVRRRVDQHGRVEPSN